MKKLLIPLFGYIFFIGVASTVFAYTFPSTNEDNKNGTNPVRSGVGPHVNLVEAKVGEVVLELVNPYNYSACFEYRSDGESSQYGDIYPHPVVTGDFWYYYECLTNETKQLTLQAENYAEVRLAVGAERDWDFDWTQFEVIQAPFIRSAEITSPLVGEEVFGTVSFNAVLIDEDGDDNVQWAVRKGTCAANTNTVLGNVDGFTSPYTWDHYNFHATADTTSWIPGEYCFIFNPTESPGDAPIRETRLFSVKDTSAPLVTIESPLQGEEVSGIVKIYGTVVEDLLLSHYNISVYPGDADFNDFSKRIAQATVYRTDGFVNELIFEWDSTNWPDGDYLIRLAARDDAGNRSYDGEAYLGGDDSQHVIMVTVYNTPDLIGPPTDKDQCKNDGWMTFDNPTFKNQGDCVSYVQSNDNAIGNKSR